MPMPVQVRQEAVYRRRRAVAAGALVAAVLLVVFAASAVLRGGGDETAANPPPTSSTTSTIPPLRTPTVGDPLRVLVAGDSLVGWIAPALEEELDGQPVAVTEDWKGSSGLVRPDFFDWPKRIEEDMAEHDPEVVVVGFGGNDTQGITMDDGHVLSLGTPEWQAEYQKRVAKVLDLIEAPGRTVYWLSLPVTRSEAIEELRPVMTGAITAEIEQRPWAHFIDTRDALAPEGTFTSQLPDADGDLVTTMAPDDIHPSLDGGVRIVDAFIPQLAEERNLST